MNLIHTLQCHLIGVFVFTAKQLCIVDFSRPPFQPALLKEKKNQSAFSVLAVREFFLHLLIFQQRKRGPRLLESTLLYLVTAQPNEPYGHCDNFHASLCMKFIEVNLL